MTIYNFGSINIDHIYRVPHLVKAGETLGSTDYQQLLGGKGANQSIALAKAGAKVVHLGRYHSHDNWITEQLNQVGVDCSQIETVDTPSGHAIIQVDDQGENSIVLYTGANHSFSHQDITKLFATLTTQANNQDWLLLQNECSAIRAAIEQAHNKGLKVAFSPAPMTADVKTLPLHLLDILIVNQGEAAELFELDLLNNNQPLADTALKALQNYTQTHLPNTHVVITLGAEGAVCLFNHSYTYQPSYPAKVVDTTGAGDTFTGYFVYALSQDNSITDALKLAAKAAALCVETAGASSSIPSILDVQAMAD